MKGEGIDEAVPRVGMEMADVMRVKLGCGEGMRGRTCASWRNDMAR